MKSLLFIFILFFYAVSALPAPLCSVVFSHDFFVDAFADVRHAGALDVSFDLNRHWLFNPKAVPQYQNPVGNSPTRLPLSDIHFMQNNIANNHSEGPYTVIGNARDIRDGKLNPETLPPISVWMDTRGKIWTLDHRRLAALILSGKVDSVNVRWASRSEVNRQSFKMSTLSEGNYTFLTAKRNQSLLVEKPQGAKQDGAKKIDKRNIPRYARRLSPDQIKQTVWHRSQPEKSVNPKLIHFSTTMAMNDRALEWSQKFQSGAAGVTVLRVWKDSSGRIWTVDNDLLAAVRLTGRKEPVPVHYLTREEFETMKIEVDSQTGGRSYVIPLKDSSSALVVH